MDSNLKSFSYRRGATQAAEKLGLTKEAVLGHLAAGPIGHFLVNALGRAAHKGSNLATVLAHKGLQHGFTDSVINPASYQSIVAMAGPEAMTVYRAGHELGKRLAALPPQVRNLALSSATKAPIESHTPILAPLQEAIKHEIAGTAPTLTAQGLPAKMYSNYVDTLSNVVNGPFDTGVQKAVKTVAGAAPAASLLALDPVGGAAHFGINKARELVGNSSLGKTVMKKLFNQGLDGSSVPTWKEALIDHAVSPAFLDPMRLGKALNEQGLSPDKLNNLSSATKTVQDKVLPLIPKTAAYSDFKNEYAPGIPDKKRIEPLPTVDKPQDWKLSLQEHQAERAGLHYDLRLIDPETGFAHSWAIPSAILPDPAKSVLAIQQPTHTKEYAMEFGKDKPEAIEKGYGKGTVKIKDLTDAEVYHSTNNDTPGTRVRFNIYRSTGPEEYAIVRTSSGQDRLVNKTLTRERLPELSIGDKPKLKEKKIDQIDFENTDEVMMPKYDGAHTLLDLRAKDQIPRLFSYRTPKRHTAGVIEHTHKLPELLVTRVPSELEGTVLRAETIGLDRNSKPIPARDIAGMLNATVPNSRRKQEEMKAHLTPILFDIDRYKGKDVTSKPFDERFELVKEIGKTLKLPVTEVAYTPEEKREMLDNIRSGTHPLDGDGVVTRPLSTNDRATKYKLRPDYDVYVRDIFEATDATGKPKGRAGGFHYSWTPRGEIQGRVGTGFSHILAKDMLQNPDKYTGRVAKIQGEQIYPTGSVAKPAFIEWHLEKGDIEKDIGK